MRINKPGSILAMALAVMMLFLGSCDKDNEARLPYYLYIDTVVVKTDLFHQGAPTHNITDLWVYAGGKFVGVFDKKKIIPILPEDNADNEILIFAGVRENGIKIEVNIYYLYKEYKYSLRKPPGVIDTVKVEFRYVDHAKFLFIEGFENTNIFNMDLDGDPATALKRTMEEACWGRYSGKVMLTEEHNIFSATTKLDYFGIPDKGNLVYLELDYKGNVPFVIGVSGKDKDENEYKQDIILLKEKDNWQKVYVNLTQTIQQSALQSYKIYFNAIHNEKAGTSLLYLDNIKLLYSDK